MIKWAVMVMEWGEKKEKEMYWVRGNGKCLD